MNKKARQIAKEQGISYMQALQSIRPPKPATPLQSQTLPARLRCPLCHAVFEPTPELLEATTCPGCEGEFAYDEEWETDD